MELAEKRRWLDMPPKEWAAAFEELSEVDRYDMVSWLDGVATYAARGAAYIEARRQGASHEKGVRRQNDMASKVRRALGYTQARDEMYF